MIFVTGDTHTPIDIKKLGNKLFEQQKNLTKADYLIIVGDFGGVWDNSKQELYWRNWLRSKNFTTLFIDGNHENHDMLDNMQVDIWNGGKVHFINDSIIHLMRGQVFTIDGLRFFTMGGADSVDKGSRREGKSWWKREIPSMQEFEEGLSNLDIHNWSVDYILTHTCSGRVLEKLYEILGFYPKPEDDVARYLSIIEQDIDFKHWYFGHFHKDVEIGEKHTLLYNKIEQIK